MPYDPIDVLVGKNVRNIRSSQGLSQSALAEKLEISFQQVQKYEKGSNRISASKLYYISEILNVPLMAFFEGAETAKETSSSVMTRRTLKTAALIESIKDEALKQKIQDVIRAAAGVSTEEEEQDAVVS